MQSNLRREFKILVRTYKDGQLSRLYIANNKLVLEFELKVFREKVAIQ